MSIHLLNRQAFPFDNISYIAQILATVDMNLY